MKKTILAIIMSAFAFQCWATDVSPTPAPSPNQTTQDVKWVNDKLQTALADMLTKATAVAGDAKDWTVAQLPDVVHQLLVWKAVESLCQPIAPLIITIICLLVIKPSRQFGHKHCDASDGFSYVPHIITIGGAIASFIVTLTQFNLVWLQIWIAPKIYLLDYAKSMVGK